MEEWQLKLRRELFQFRSMVFYLVLRRMGIYLPFMAIRRLLLRRSMSDAWQLVWRYWEKIRYFYLGAFRTIQKP